MRSFTAVGEKAIGTTGFILFGALTLIVAILKLTVITDWSWWPVSLPIAIFVGFNMAYILVGFISLSLVSNWERPPEDEAALFEGHHHIPHTWISLLFFALFVDNLVGWWEGADSSHWSWLLSGQIEAVLIFAGLSVAGLFLYWSRTGPMIGGHGVRSGSYNPMQVCCPQQRRQRTIRVSVSDGTGYARRSSLDQCHRRSMQALRLDRVRICDQLLCSFSKERGVAHVR